MKLTDTTIRSLKLPHGKTDVITFDEVIAGFGLRLRQSKPGGPVAQSWLFQYRSRGGETRRITFGVPATLSAKAAREEAARLHAQVRLGGDPQARKEQDRAAAQETFAAVAAQYLKKREAEVAAGKLAPRTYEQIEKSLVDHWQGLNRHPVRDISQRLVADHMDRIEGLVAANRARQWLSHFFVWCMGRGITDKNPVALTNRPTKETPRDRVLSDPELIAVWNACGGDDDFSKITRLLLLTGQRRDEVGGMTWAELDLDNAVWNLPASRAKNRRSHDVPLSPQAIGILRTLDRRERPFVFGRDADSSFSGWAYAKAALDGRIAAAWPPNAKPIEHWTLHDLRRTAATIMAELPRREGDRQQRVGLGIAPHIVEAVLNHAGHRAGIVGVYNKASYASEMRRALDLWANHIEALVSGEQSNVVPMKASA